MTVPTIDELTELSAAVEEQAKVLKESIKPFGTAEQWRAVGALTDAARYIHSAAGWLAYHDEKHGAKG